MYDIVFEAFERGERRRRFKAPVVEHAEERTRWKNKGIA